MFSFSMPELMLVLVIALVVFGPGKLPDVGKALGRSLQEFRQATTAGQPAGPIKTIEAEPQPEPEQKI